MDVILQGCFDRYKEDFGLISNNDQEDNAIFERFVNYTIFSSMDPDVFIGNEDLLDSICTGGADDIGIDGLGILINGILVGSCSEALEIAKRNKKVYVEFIFIQSKKQPNFENSEFRTFGDGVKAFFANTPVYPENEKIQEARKLKDYIYSESQICRKLRELPSVKAYYVTAGDERENEYIASLKKIYEKEIGEQSLNLKDIDVDTRGRNYLIGLCNDLENSLSVEIDQTAIIPMAVPNCDEIKKAYIFTCQASEFIKILQREDGLLRRSLFNDNVRDYLGDKGSVNHEIIETMNLEPERFILYNNGITIVCSEFEQIRNNLIRISNPQIVNGCQTSSTLYYNKDNADITKIQLLVRVICTEDNGILNNIVRGTNKQNQVLDEAFETTKPFHHELEKAFSFISQPEKLYYERRSKQYSYDPIISKTRIVKLRNIIQTSVSALLRLPHKSHLHEALLIKEYCGEDSKLFNKADDPEVYYLMALLWYRFEEAKRKKLIPKNLFNFKGHLYTIFILMVHPSKLSTLKGRKNKSWNDLKKALQENEFEKRLPKVIEHFEKLRDDWTKRNSIRVLKENKEFTDILLRSLLDKSNHLQLTSKSDEDKTFTGRILSFINDKRWFGFISPDNDSENVYFDGRSYKGETRKLIPNVKVEYIAKMTENGLRATIVKVLE